MKLNKEIKIISSDRFTHDSKEFSDSVNNLLKDGWIILSTSCGSYISENKDNSKYSPMSIHNYTAILYKEII